MFIVHKLLFSLPEFLTVYFLLSPKNVTFARAKKYVATTFYINDGREKIIELLFFIISPKSIRIWTSFCTFVADYNFYKTNKYQLPKTINHDIHNNNPLRHCMARRSITRWWQCKVNIKKQMTNEEGLNKRL